MNNVLHLSIEFFERVSFDRFIKMNSWIWVDFR